MKCVLRISTGWFPLDHQDIYRRRLPKVASTSCLSDMCNESAATMHPAISNTNLAAMRLKPMAVTMPGTKGDIFHHPAIFIPQDEIMDGEVRQKAKQKYGIRKLER